MDDPFLRFVFLTLPSQTSPTLNVTIGNTHHRYRITRDQLFALNAQTADALSKGRIEDKSYGADGEQLLLNFPATHSCA
jgi:hypothetical protein